METPHEQPAETVRTAGVSAGDPSSLTPQNRSTGPRRRRVLVPVGLFFATCFTTFLAGCAGWNFWDTPLTSPVWPGQIVVTVIEVQPGDTYTPYFKKIVNGKIEYIKGAKRTTRQPHRALASWSDGLRYNWKTGVFYMCGVMAILLFHEMGHFLMTLRYKIPASLPIFLPIPNIFGTFGAFIALTRNHANRKEVFDIGIAGPLAGLVLTIPLLLYGLSVAEPIPEHPQARGYGDPLLVKLLIPLLHNLDEVKKAYAEKHNDPTALQKPFTFVVNPIYMAAWVGMFITAVNMFPVKQLDGGHVAYALFGTYAHWIGRMVVLGAIVFTIYTRYFFWALMILLVILMPRYPATFDDNVKLGPWRYVLGISSFLIPVFCFTPFPIINLY